MISFTALNPLMELFVSGCVTLTLEDANVSDKCIGNPIFLDCRCTLLPGLRHFKKENPTRDHSGRDGLEPDLELGI